MIMIIKNKLMKHNLIYQTTNTITNKTYIGRHSTNRINDGYLGSGRSLKKDIKLFGREIFDRIILFDFDTKEEMYAKEIELLTDEFVRSENTYNIVGGSTTVEFSVETKKMMSDNNKGLVTVKDSSGKCYRVKKDDPRYLSGELIFYLTGTVVVKDSDGNRFRVPIDDSRYIAGELINSNIGNKRSPEVVEHHAQKMREYWANNPRPEDVCQVLREANINRVTVIDSDGKKFRVSVFDPRYISGELKNAYIGTKQTAETCKKISQNKKGCIWIHNPELQQTKLARPELAKELLESESGWIKGQVHYNKNK